MAPDVTSSNTSPELPVDDDPSMTESDDYSSGSDASSDDIVHIGFFSRPQLPRFISTLPHRKLRGGSLSRRPNPHPPGKSAHRTFLRPPTNPVVVGPDGGSRPPPPPWPSTSQHDFGIKSHGKHCDSLLGSVHEYDEAHDDDDESSNTRRLTEQYVGLKDRRSLLLTVLDRAQTQQALVRNLRQTKDEVDGEFMASAHALLSNNSELHQLHQLFNTVQETRRQYKEAEQHLSAIIDELHSGHKDLESHEESFYLTAIGALGTDAPNSHEDDRSENSEDLALRGITGDRPESFHPLYAKLLGAFGQLQLARELLVNTQMRREALLARKTQPLTDNALDLLENYGDAGRAKALEIKEMALMTEDDEEQLQHYHNLEQEAKREIDTHTERVMLLRNECREIGALPKFSPFYQKGLEPDLFYRDEIHLAQGPFDTNDESATLAHPIFPLLLSNPTHVLHGFPQTAMQSLQMALQLQVSPAMRAKKVGEAAHEVNMNSILSTVESDDTGDYINRWLLHKLYFSAMEAELLWTTFRARLKILDIDRWQRDILRFWWHDKPGHLASTIVVDNGTDKASRSDMAGAGFNMLSHSDSGQLEGIRDWNLDNSWFVL